ncbi:hypothetical protein AMTR_s00038p00099650 [Amborella trichopoda]|uniref:DUF7780 domain-containing protein n=1 Tax=Amborella trichopoda TaxID=13333 RepID=U5CN35_AMBTC|nr:hypothetical protein AMTR_s00038p00099650 [Amborella trichopoda]
MGVFGVKSRSPTSGGSFNPMDRSRALLVLLFPTDGMSSRCSLTHRARSTISLCALLLISTLLLFLLFSPSPHPPSPANSRSKIVTTGTVDRRLALHGMGTLYRRGTRGMAELIVAHITNSTTKTHLRMFLRTLHRSGALARADLVLLFPTPLIPPSSSRIIEDENLSFLNLLNQTQKSGDICPFKPNVLSKACNSKPAYPNPLWGTATGVGGHAQRNKSDQCFAWGSVVGFVVNELNPDDALSGFIDQPPIELRRWACYQMLLGKLRHRVKHVLLTEITGTLIIGDALSPLRKAARNNVLFLALEESSWGEGMRGVYGKEAWGEVYRSERGAEIVNSGVVMGAMGAVRRLANAMITEIVKVALLRKRRGAFPDSVLLTYLVRQSSVARRNLGNMHLVGNSDSVVHSLSKSTQESIFTRSKSLTPVSTSPLSLSTSSSPSMSGSSTVRYTVIHGYTSERSVGGVNLSSVVEIVHRDICSSWGDSSPVYRDCSESYTQY